MKQFLDMIQERRRPDCFFLLPKLTLLQPQPPMPATIQHHPSKTSCHTSCHLRLKKIAFKITLETYNGVDDATPAPKSVSYEKPLCNCLLKIRQHKGIIC